MKLYYSPGACSLAPHIALHEIGVPFTTAKVDLHTHKLADGTDYYTINPKGYVPLLELDDGERLTEVAVILQYIADRKPGDARPGVRHDGALPPDGMAQLHRDRGPQAVRPAVVSDHARGDQGSAAHEARDALRRDLRRRSRRSRTSPARSSRSPTPTSSRSSTGRACSRSISRRGPRCSSSRRASPRDRRCSEAMKAEGLIKDPAPSAKTDAATA